MKNFREIVSAEDFSNEVWTKRDSVVVFLIPLIFLIGFIMQKFFANSLVPTIVDTGIRILIFIGLMGIYKNMFVRHWKKFKLSWKRSLLLVVGGAIIMQIIITIIRNLVPVQSTGVPTESVEPFMDPVTAASVCLLL